MAKTIWVIEQGSYSDYRVVGVFTSKKNAEAVKAKMETYGSWDDPTIAEWELDQAVSQINKGYKIFNVYMLINGDVETISEQSYFQSHSSFVIWKRTEALAYKGKGVPDCLSATVWARNVKHAVKIVNEKRAQMIANGEWNE